MILGINGVRLLGQRGGVGRCIEAILRSLGEVEHPFEEIRVYTPRPLDGTIELPPRASNVVLASRLPLGLWEQLRLPAAHGRHHVLLCPSYVVPLLARCPTFLIHHGSYEGYPTAFPWWIRHRARMVYSMSARRATELSTVSELSRRDISRFYRIDPARIHLVPEGVDTRLFRPLTDHAEMNRKREEWFGPETPYLVYVGKPTERRNLTPLLHAFASLKKKSAIAHRLLLVGVDLPGRAPVRQVIAELGLERDVVTWGYASHDTMAWVYNGADLLVYPSSYEGFGMPVLEAMACGTPVVALEAGAIPEFAGGLAHLLPDARVETLAAGILAGLTDRGWRDRMAQEGPRRAAGYDWRVVTRRYLDLLVPLARRLPRR